MGSDPGLCVWAKERNGQEMKHEAQVGDLKIDVAGILPASGDHRKVESSADIQLCEGYDMKFQQGDAVRWSLELRRITGAVEVAGTIDGEIRMQCYRCLQDFSWAFSVRLREHALWITEPVADIGEETASDYVITDGMLDLEPVLRDSIALAFPVKRVCDEACKGLCARCGANLNLEPCDCEPPPPDERLSPLAELKRRLEK
jgi:uncharacterized protein